MGALRITPPICPWMATELLLDQASYFLLARARFNLGGSVTASTIATAAKKYVPQTMPPNQQRTAARAAAGVADSHSSCSCRR
jgi:hypothetical protein